MAEHDDMARPYAGEMERLADTLSWVGQETVDRLRTAVRAAAFSPLRAIGSGGSLTAAVALTALHQRFTGHLAAVATPLDAVDEPVDAGVSQWLLSAGGRNVDIMRAADALIRREPRQLGVLCGKPDSPLAELCRDHPFVDLVLAPPPAGKDGFLATNSLLAFVGLLSRAYATEFGGTDCWSQIERTVATLVEDSARPASPWRRQTDALWSRGTTIVLHSTATRVGAVDLESKFTEAALGNLQIADYRNFAHGRHHWLAKQGHISGVLAFITEADRSLADRTLALLPRDIPLARLDLPGDEVATNLGALVAALRISGWAGAARGIDPGQPGVPDFGRKLYNLPLARPIIARLPRGLSERAAAAIRRKAGVSVEALAETGELEGWRRAIHQFRTTLSEVAFAGVVLDYDGTVVDTRDRFEPPTQPMTDQLIRLAEAGVPIAIATGRGGSVRRDLAKRVPPALQSQFLIGYYNGAEIADLGDATAPDNRPEVCAELQTLAEALARQPELALAARQEHRPFQITLEAVRMMPESRLWDLAQQVILMTGADVKVTRSSHSVDIVPAAISKLNVLAALRRRVGDAPLLTIGDRGRWPGNDYELLRGPYSLGVDEVSIDPAACWNLARPGQRGMTVTLEYLTALLVQGDGVQLAPDALP
jgi:trehalose-6-phosphatase